MARLLSALLLIAWSTLLRTTEGQIMMVPLAALRHPHHQVVPMGIRTVAVPVEEQQTTDADYTPSEPIDEAKVQLRIKELGEIRQELANKQMDLQDKLRVLQEQAMAVQSKIDQDQAQMRKYDEVERLHYLEQLRLERMIHSQRVDMARERMNQDRLAQQRAVLEGMEAERHKSYESKEPTHDRHDGYTSKQVGFRVNEASQDTEPVGGISPAGGHKNERPHSTTTLEQSALQETQLTGIHGISKKEILGPAGTAKVIAVEDKRLAPANPVISSRHFEPLGHRRNSSVH